VIWLLKDFDLLGVILRACTLAFEALTLGGVAFLLMVVRAPSSSIVPERLFLQLRRAGRAAAISLLLAQLTSTALSVLMLVSGSGLPLWSVASASFVFAGLGVAGCALVIALLLSVSTYSAAALCACVPAASALLAGSVAMSHAASKLEHRVLLCFLTAAHHLGMAGWIGAMVFLLLALRHPAISESEAMLLSRRYSFVAMVSVSVLVMAGVGLSYFYIGSWTGLYTTSYGVLVVAKTYLLLTMLLLGASHQRLLRRRTSIGRLSESEVRGGLLMRLRRFSEAEIGLGFTAVLAAASLTSQAPSVDLAPRDRLTTHEIVERLRWKSPRLHSPPLSELAPPTTLEQGLPAQQFGNGSVSDANDRAWSEYNHHWAGLILLTAAALALVSRTIGAESLRRLARNWPLMFLGLAIFILFRADPENWPLGPRPFWASFSRPDVLEHRVYALLISAFAVFEWSVERGKLRQAWASYVFPLVVAAGGAVLLTHSHAAGDVHDELLAGVSHTAIAVLGATAGWARWIELRLAGGRESRIAALVWPLCLILVGVVLLDYREG
jgi:putative copper resistance protein D